MVSPQCQLVPLVVPCLLSRLYNYIFPERLLQSLVVSPTKLSSLEMHVHHKKSSKWNLVAMLTRCWHLLMAQLLFIIQDYIWRLQSTNKVYDIPFLVSEKKNLDSIQQEMNIGKFSCGVNTNHTAKETKKQLLVYIKSYSPALTSPS